MAADKMDIVPLIFSRWSESFGEVDWTVFVNGPFELTTPLQAMMMEAGQKGMAVIVQAALVPSEDIFEAEPEEEPKAEPIEEDKKAKKG